MNVNYHLRVMKITRSGMTSLLGTRQFRITVILASLREQGHVCICARICVYVYVCVLLQD